MRVGLQHNKYEEKEEQKQGTKPLNWERFTFSLPEGVEREVWRIKKDSGQIIGGLVLKIWCFLFGRYMSEFPRSYKILENLSALIPSPLLAYLKNSCEIAKRCPKSISSVVKVSSYFLPKDCIMFCHKLICHTLFFSFLFQI